MFKFKKDFWWASAVVALVFVFSWVSLNRAAAFGSASLEIRKEDRAANLVNDFGQVKFKASNNPEGCAFRVRKASVLDDYLLASYLADGAVFGYAEMTDPQAKTEYVVTLRSRGREKTYYFSGQIPGKIRKIIRNLEKPWAKELAKLGFI